MSPLRLRQPDHAFVACPAIRSRCRLSQPREAGRTWLCCAHRMWSEWDEHYFEQVRQWEAGLDSDSTLNDSSSPDDFRPGRRLPDPVPAGSRYHSSRSGGPWGFSVSRGRADDWRGACFEWEGWTSGKPAGWQRRRRHMYNGDNSDFEAIEDLYGVLGVPRFASEDTVRRGYRLMAKRWHPDTYTHKSTQDGSRLAAEYVQMRFIRVQEAMDVLGNPLKRRAYDRKLSSRGNAEYMGTWPDVRTSAASRHEVPLEERDAQLPESDYDDFDVRYWRANQID